jgi:hypothetical protein
MDFDFTPEQDAFRAVVREFARAEIAPHAGDWDQCGQFPCEVVTKMGALRLFGLLVPEDFGGSAADFTTFCTAIEELDPAEREAFVAERIEEYEADVDLVRLASDLVIDAVVPHDELRDELVAHFRAAANKDRFFSDRRHGNPPV